MAEVIVLGTEDNRTNQLYDSLAEIIYSDQAAGMTIANIVGVLQILAVDIQIAHMNNTE